MTATSHAKWLFGTIVAVALLVAAQWTWLQGSHALLDWRDPEIAGLGVRAFAVAAAAAGQWVIVTIVFGGVFRSGDRRRAPSSGTAAAMVRLGLLLIVAVGVISGVALTVAAR